MKADKKNLRADIRQRLKKLSTAEQQKKSRQICQHLEQATIFQSAKSILSFSALQGEPDLMPLFKKKQPSTSFLFPLVVAEQLELRLVGKTSHLIPGYANILEPSPDHCPLFAPEQLDLILLPGLAFSTTTGARLGKGKGFYDRLIEGLKKDQQHPPTIIGVCFDCQISKVPEEPHDQRADFIVSEKGLI